MLLLAFFLIYPGFDTPNGLDLMSGWNRCLCFLQLDADGQAIYADGCVIRI